MSSKTTAKGARVVALIFVVFAGVTAWFIAPWFLPVYQWTSVDFAKIAKQHELTDEQAQRLATAETYTFRYHPRGKDDPRPWQVLFDEDYQSPSWVVTDEGRAFQEYAMVVRVDLISNRTGELPGVLFKGSAPWDNYFTAQAWRLPPGSLGRSHPKPVFLYQGSSWEKLSVHQGKIRDAKLNNDLKKENVISDDWPGVAPWRDDGYVPPSERPEAASDE